MVFSNIPSQPSGVILKPCLQIQIPVLSSHPCLQLWPSHCLESSFDNTGLSDTEIEIMLQSFQPPHDKTNTVVVRPAKTQISLGIHPVWSVSLLSAWRKLESLATHWADSEDSDQTWHTFILLVLSRGGSFVTTVTHTQGRAQDSGQNVPAFNLCILPAVPDECFFVFWY